MIKNLKKEIECDDIVEYYTVKDRIYYMIVNMELNQGSNKIVIEYKIESMIGYGWVLIIVGIALLGFVVLYIKLRYKDNRIRDFISLDKIVKCFIWIKKPFREKLLNSSKSCNNCKSKKYCRSCSIYSEVSICKKEVKNYEN